MASIFGRKKGRPRQSSVSVQDLNERSVPYDQTTPARSPIAVSTFSQGIRGISAPNTNPALTDSGTELNKFAMQRSKLERDRAYELHSRQDSPTTSTSTTDSSTLYDGSTGSLNSPKTPIPHPQTERVRRSEAPSTRSQNMDFGQNTSQGYSPSTMRPTSGMTSRSETTRNSRYASSVTSSETGSHHSHNPFHHHRHDSESFNFPRPENDDDIEVLFDKVMRTRGDPKGTADNLSIEQKWELVRNDERIRWKEQKQRGEQSRKQQETGQVAAVIQDSPQWYIQKFMDRTITPKQAGSLLVSLRSKELRYGHLQDSRPIHSLSTAGFRSSSSSVEHLSLLKPCRISVGEVEIVLTMKSLSNTKSSNV